MGAEPDSSQPDHSKPSYVSRGGIKLRAALDAFELDVTGLRCVDLGCSVGGFSDCLLQAGAASVVCVDTAYAQLAWKLRTDDRVTVMERTNALHAEPPDGFVDLAVIDLGWTPQAKAITAALRWLVPGGRIISLIKPHYELAEDEKSLLTDGVLSNQVAERVSVRVYESLGQLGVEACGLCVSPLRGSPKKNRPEGVGNREWLAIFTTPD
ncbi:MAG: SAM-dependent methyltransferase [Planctomycetota bacterium]